MNIELLSRCYGVACGLVSLPLNVRLGFDKAMTVGAWTAAYHRRGLAFGGERQTVEALRCLVNGGLLQTAGATQSKAWRLTVSGVLTAMASQDLNPEFSRVLLARIAEFERASKVILPGTDHKLVMGWLLVPTAGAWFDKALASETAWKKYQSELHGLQVRLDPLLVLRFVEVYTDCHACLWGCRVTDAGRAALQSWPAAPAPVTADDAACFSAWSEGYLSADSYADRPPPPDFRNTLARRLPASQW